MKHLTPRAMDKLLDTEVILERRINYGAVAYYPLDDCKIGQMVTALTGNKTVTCTDISTMRCYGYTFVYINHKGDKVKI